MRNISLVIVLTIVIVFISLGLQAAGAQTVPDRTAAGPSRLSELLRDDRAKGYAQALKPREFSFPEDHGPHPAYRNEWWYVTGNLTGSREERFGFELTIFRFALTPEAETGRQPDASAWRTRQVYIGHFAITDAQDARFHVSERYARGALGLAGASSQPFNVWVEDWWLKEYPTGDDAAWLLHANDDGIELTLTLVPLKDPVLNGVDGLSQKSDEPGNASYYYSIPRLQTDGTLRIDEEIYDVSGLSWLDREWGSSALSKDQQGWDWFALQLSDGSDLMFYKLRRTDGSTDTHSAGTWIPPEGDSVHLTHDEVTIDVRDYWDSPEGGRYPAAWTISVPTLDLVLEIDPVLDAQELATDVRYWEGAVDVKGQRNGQDITGRGYVELTGYANSE